jgi:hypothetical protein
LFGNIADKSRIGEPSRSVLRPLLEAAIDESREQLQDLWARMLANSMIDGGSKVRNDFFTTLKGLELLDVAVLDLFSMPEIAEFTNEQRSRMTHVLRERRVEGFNEDALTVSLEALQASRYVIFGASNVWRLMAYGRAFMTACRVE